MSAICFRSVEPNSVVDQLYDANSEAGSIYSGSGTPPNCSPTDLPSPSSCVVCFQKFSYAVCSDLLKNAKLLMEEGGREIDLIKSECPIFSATNEKADLSGDDTGASKWWLLLLLLIVPVMVAAFKYGKDKCSNNRRRQMAPDADSPV